MQEFLKSFAEAISPALQVLIQAVVLALIAQATAWVRKLYQQKRGQLSAQQQYLLDQIAYGAVRAAEQVYESNSDKRSYATEVVEKTLKGYGFNFDLDVIVAAIERQVFDKKREVMKNGF